MINILNPVELADGSQRTIRVGLRKIGLMGTGLQSYVSERKLDEKVTTLRARDIFKVKTSLDIFSLGNRIYEMRCLFVAS